jgi:hypothetical protein
VPVNFTAFGPPLFDTSFYKNNVQRHRAVFNGIYQMPYDFQLSGVYFYGDNGYLTTTSGIDVTGCNCTVANRLRADRSVIPRNNFNKKDLHRVDIRLYRAFRFSERTSIEPTLEVFNLFNRENFTSWALNESSPTFGQPVGVTGVAFAPRMIQLGFRARF